MDQVDSDTDSREFLILRIRQSSPSTFNVADGVCLISMMTGPRRMGRGLGPAPLEYEGVF